MKLIKHKEGYSLCIEETGSNSREFIATTDGMYVKHMLSKQNCDEIFGVVDVDKLAKEETRKYLPGCPENIMNFIAHERFFKIAFEQAMELNKDKLFTVEDMKGFAGYVWKMVSNRIDMSSIEHLFEKYTQPTEIEVEIEMEYQGFEVDGKIKESYLPKLDENGCLILKKK